MATLESTLAVLHREQIRLREGILAPNTYIGYAFDLKMYEKWIASLHLPIQMDNSETLLLFLTDQLYQGKKLSTVRRRKCAIVHACVSKGLPSPMSIAAVELLHGAQRLRGEKPRQMRPITVPQLRKMSGALSKIGTPVAMRNRALLVVGFSSALRRCNLAALNLADVEFCKQGVILRIDREKQDQEGHGRIIGLPHGLHVHTDPVGVLKGWLRIRGAIPGPLFWRLDPLHKGARIDGESVWRVVKKSLALIGVSAVSYGAHSLRSGFCTAAGQANLSALRIAAFTGQSPEIVQRYFRSSEIWRQNVGGELGL